MGKSYPKNGVCKPCMQMLQGKPGKACSTKQHLQRKRRLTGKMRQRLTSAARCAIKMHSKEANQKETIKKLQRDLQNGPFHCFGMHTNCSSDFCREKQQQNEMVDNHGSTEDESLDDIPQIAVDQVMLNVMHNHLHIDFGNGLCIYFMS